MIPLITLLAIVLLAVFGLKGTYNRLVRARVSCDTAWCNIDVQLKRRHDLIASLVETARSYAVRENSTLEDVTKCRAIAIEAATPDKAAAESQLSEALKNLFAVLESYPGLKASQQFAQLQTALDQTEDSIQSARITYNAIACSLNSTVQSFPANILASVLGFQQRQFCDVARSDLEWR